MLAQIYTGIKISGYSSGHYIEVYVLLILLIWILFCLNNLHLLFREKSRKECMPESLNRCSSSFIKKIIFVLKDCILIAYSLSLSSKWFKMYWYFGKKKKKNHFQQFQNQKISTMCFIYHKKIVEIFSNYSLSNWSPFL